MEDILPLLASEVPPEDFASLVGSSRIFPITPALLEKVSWIYNIPTAKSLDEIVLFSRLSDKHKTMIAVNRDDLRWIVNNPPTSDSEVSYIIEYGSLRMIDEISQVIDPSDIRDINSVIRDKRRDVIAILVKNGWKPSAFHLNVAIESRDSEYVEYMLSVGAKPFSSQEPLLRLGNTELIKQMLMKIGKYHDRMQLETLVTATDDPEIYDIAVEYFPGVVRNVVEHILEHGSVKMFEHIKQDITDWRPLVKNPQLLQYVHESGYHNMAQTYYVNQNSTPESINYLLDIGVIPNDETIKMILNDYGLDEQEQFSLLQRIIQIADITDYPEIYEKLLWSHKPESLFSLMLDRGYPTSASLLTHETPYLERVYDLLPKDEPLSPKNLAVAWYNDSLLERMLQEHEIIDEDDESASYLPYVYEDYDLPFRALARLQSHGLFMDVTEESVDEEFVLLHY